MKHITQDLESKKAKLERDRARFLEDAIARDKKMFAFSSPTVSPKPLQNGDCREGRQPQAGDSSLASPGFHRHLMSSGTLMVADSLSSIHGDFDGSTRLTFTPPKASPSTARLLANIGINVKGFV